MAEINSTDNPVEYRNVAGFPGYRVGSDGTVWTAWTQIGFGGHKKTIGDTWRRLNPWRDSRGYLMVMLSPGPKSRRVHRLVLEAFVGLRPPGMQCCHYDGNPANNCLSNLRWDTKANNAADKFRHGTQPLGEQIHCAKLTEEDVRTIRLTRVTTRKTVKQIAAEHGVLPQTIEKVISRETWAHVK